MSETGYDSIWKDTLKAIEQSNYFPSDTFHAWIMKTSLFKIEDDKAYVVYFTVITYNILKQQKEKELFESTLSEIYGAPLKIQFVSQKEKERLIPEILVEKRTKKLMNVHFNPAYTFENFIEGNSNNEAYSACVACCVQNRRMFNPILIYGNSGLGKTHLLHAIGNYLKKEKPETKVFYSYSGELVDILLEAMKSKNVSDIKEQLIENDFFLIDDIQNLRQQASQEVFFTVYNALIEKNAQIIITSDTHPRELNNLPNRLISRFDAGLSVNISRPEFLTSKAILKKKLEGIEETLQIKEEVLDYLAHKFSNDVRNLEGSLNKLIFNATLENPDVIDLEFAQHILMNVPVVSTHEELSSKKSKKPLHVFMVYLIRI